MTWIINFKQFSPHLKEFFGIPPSAEFFHVYDVDGNIVRSIDISGKKEYNYEYEEGRIVRATEADIELSGEIVTLISTSQTK